MFFVEFDSKNQFHFNFVHSAERCKLIKRNYITLFVVLLTLRELEFKLILSLFNVDLQRTDIASGLWLCSNCHRYFTTVYFSLAIAYDKMVLITLNTGEKRRVEFKARPENGLNSKTAHSLMGIQQNEMHPAMFHVSRKLKRKTTQIPQQTVCTLTLLTSHPLWILSKLKLRGCS